MKLKYYLRGLGIGILVTAAILMIVYHTKGTLSDAQIKEKAAELGMVMASSEPDMLFTTSEDEENTTEEIDETTTEENTTEETTAEETTTAEKETQPETESSTEPVTTEPETKPAETDPVATESQNEVISATLTIRGGMYSESVSAELVRLGIIDNQAEFNSFLEKNGYAERIQTGDFNVSSDMTYEQIARIITRS